MKYKVISNFFAMGQLFRIGAEVTLPPELEEKFKACLSPLAETKPPTETKPRQKKVK